MTILGLLLAGGASRRFGSEKAMAPHGAGRLMDAPLQALIGVSDQVAVSARPGSGAARLAETAELPLLFDPPGAPEGPLAGLLAGLRWADDQGAALLLTAPCDAPGLTVDHFAALLAAADPCAAAAETPHGLEPLIAAWPVARARRLVEARSAAAGHPAVRQLLTELDLIAVTVADTLNINSQADLAPLELACKPTPAHARLFHFEDDFVRTLRCIPMCVRFKLDRVGIKLSLRQWSRLTLDERDTLRRQPCDTPETTQCYRADLIACVQRRSGEDVTALQSLPAPSWLEETTPQQLLDFARAEAVSPPTSEQWRRLAPLERYTLIKLTRDRHENANFGPALAEFLD